MMPWKDDILYFPDELDPESTLIRMRINTERGAVVDFVVQLEMLASDAEPASGYVVVVRYDGSHGRAHRDILDRTGKTTRKIWLPDHLAPGKALEYALDDVKHNWHRYRDDFGRRCR